MVQDLLPTFYLTVVCVAVQGTVRKQQVSFVGRHGHRQGAQPHPRRIPDERLPHRKAGCRPGLLRLLGLRKALLVSAQRSFLHLDMGVVCGLDRPPSCLWSWTLCFWYLEAAVLPNARLVVAIPSTRANRGGKCSGARADVERMVAFVNRTFRHTWRRTRALLDSPTMRIPPPPHVNIWSP